MRRRCTISSATPARESILARGRHGARILIRSLDPHRERALLLARSHDQVLPLARGKVRPPLERELARDSWSPPHRNQRRFDRDGARPADGVADRLVPAKPGGQKQRRRERLPQRRFCLQPAPPALVEEQAAGVDADGADVALETGEKELRIVEHCLFDLRPRRLEAGPRLQRRMQPFRHRVRVVEPRLPASDPEPRARSLAQVPLQGSSDAFRTSSGKLVARNGSPDRSARERRCGARD